MTVPITFDTVQAEVAPSTTPEASPPPSAEATPSRGDSPTERSRERALRAALSCRRIRRRAT